ncbi:hypothetical protein KSC_032170 [Ktedonobacter sp. SOSP1-52]|nr:hypothetical protein KSC_032170 [Ktedonobacter sp. SOSP1-52]
MLVIALGLKSLKPSKQGGFITNPMGQTPARKDANLNLCHIQPTPVFGSEMKLQTT